MPVEAAVLAVPVLVAVAVAVYLSCFSPDYRVERSIEVACSPRVAYDYVMNLRRWPEWNPWLLNEPDCPLVFSGAPSSVGGWYEWNGRCIGTGRITHQSVEMEFEIIQKLAFARPVKANCQAIWRFEPTTDGGVRVIWTLVGRLPFFLRFLVKRMDSMLGGDFELGLILLRAALDGNADRLSINYGEAGRHKPRTALTFPVRGDLTAIRRAMEEHFPELLDIAGDRAAGFPFAAYHEMRGDVFGIDIAVPVPEDFAGTPSPYVKKKFPGGDFLPVTHTGDYAYLKHTWRSAFAYLRMRKIKFDHRRPCFEEYRNAPQDTAKNDRLTVIYLPLQGKA